MRSGVKRMFKYVYAIKKKVMNKKTLMLYYPYGVRVVAGPYYKESFRVVDLKRENVYCRFLLGREETHRNRLRFPVVSAGSLSVCSPYFAYVGKRKRNYSFGIVV